MRKIGSGVLLSQDYAAPPLCAGGGWLSQRVAFNSVRRGQYPLVVAISS